MDDGLQRHAVIDVGTNSVKFHIAERDPELGQQTLTVSDRGLRHGLLIHRFGT